MYLRRLSYVLSILSLTSKFSVAEDVTLFYPAAPTISEYPYIDSSETILGIEPVSVDETGATHYVGSQVFSHVVFVDQNYTSTVVSVAEPSTTHFTFVADATRHRVIQTRTISDDAGYGVSVDELDCVLDEEGEDFSCVHKIVDSASGQPPSTAYYNPTWSGAKSAYWTIENVETFSIPRPTVTGEDTGEEDSDSGVGSRVLRGADVVVGLGVMLFAGMVLV
ncbi:hypothetical protein CC2G_002761 [Coprinopsis cinerea AmutBmut pab1-1]|nr:hypothetical protein CC2G_002761 [Coprinopsis cinerea AmutBmut pab1-1]